MAQAAGSRPPYWLQYGGCPGEWMDWRMAVDGKLLEILCCPVSKVPLSRLQRSRLDKLNQAIAGGAVQTVRGKSVSAPLQEALITEDGKVIYPVVDDIPLLLEEQGIGTLQLQDF
jgi:uncharacterized protein YbaR (Trm112 family)